MSKNTFVLALCFIVLALVLTNIIPQDRAYSRNPVTAGFGDAPKSITDIMAGDGEALTKEVNAKKKQIPAKLELPLAQEGQ